VCHAATNARDHKEYIRMDKARRTAQTALEDTHLATPSQFHHLCELVKDFKAPNTCTDWGHIGSLAHLNELVARVIEHLQPST
jgi:hypothetical protein